MFHFTASVTSELVQHVTTEQIHDYMRKQVSSQLLEMTSISTAISTAVTGSWFSNSEGPKILVQLKQKKNRGLSPRANYTDEATAACRRS
jgi:hypothetical protein